MVAFVLQNVLFSFSSFSGRKKDCKNSHFFELFKCCNYFFLLYPSSAISNPKYHRTSLFLYLIYFYMSKRILKPLIIAIIALISIVLLWKNMNNTSSWEPNLFALKNANQVDKFTFIPNNEKIKPLEFFKKDNIWYVKNDKQTYPADTNNINLILNWAMPKLKIKMPVSDQIKKHVVRQMALSGTKATFFINNKPVHTIYVGESAMDNMSTYMYYPDTERPCLVEIPSFQGYLTPYFNTDIQIWRSLYLVNSDVKNIKSLEVIWPNNPKNSFKILQENNELSLFDVNSKSVAAQKSLMAGYLLMCKDFTREAGNLAGINKEVKQRDSILKTTPLVVFKYTFENKPPLDIQIYPHYGYEDVAIDAKPNETKTNQTALYWTKVSNDPYLWLTQDIVLHNRFKIISDFLK